MISAIAVCGLSTGDMCKTSDTGKFGVAVRDKNGIFRCCEDKSCLPGKQFIYFFIVLSTASVPSFTTNIVYSCAYCQYA